MANLLSWFIPKEEKFFSMLKKQSKSLFYAANDFKNFITNFNSMTETEKKDFLKKIKKLENDGDEICHMIIEKLNKTFIVPIDREDIHSLTVLLDDILDHMHTTTNRLIVYRMKQVPEPVKQFATIIFEQVIEIDKAISDLKQLNMMGDHLVKINKLENEADDLHTKALGDLFDKEKDAKEIMKLREIYGLLEMTTDKGEGVSHTLENIRVKHA
jgi:uncharacterized protein